MKKKKNFPGGGGGGFDHRGAIINLAHDSEAQNYSPLLQEKSPRKVFFNIYWGNNHDMIRKKELVKLDDEMGEKKMERTMGSSFEYSPLNQKNTGPQWRIRTTTRQATSRAS